MNTIYIHLCQNKKNKNREELFEEKNKILNYLKEFYKGEKNVEIINPSNHAYLPVGRINKSIAFLGEDLIQSLSYANLVFFAKGWEESKSCKAIHNICELFNIPYINYTESMEEF